MLGENEEADQPTSELVNKLKEFGLDPEHWLPVLDTLLGIKHIQSLKYIQVEDFSVLEDKIRYPWERSALQKLFNIPERSLSTTELKEKQRHLLKEETEELFKLQTQLKKLRTEGESQHDKTLKQKEEMQKTVEMHTEYPAPESTFLDLTHHFGKQINVTDESYLKKENLKDDEVIAFASGGLALEGIFQTKNTEDLFKKRDPILSVPDSFRIVCTKQSPVFQQKEFTCHQEELNFQKTVEKGGLSFTSSVTAGFGGLGLHISSQYSTSSESDKCSKKSSDRTDVLTTRYNYIPLASCYFTEDQLRLSKAALNALKEIENIINIDSSECEKKCAEFFQRFGSHANQGPIHFGGIFWWKASMEGVEISSLEEAKEITCKALDNYIGGSYAGIGGGIDLSTTDTKGSMDRSIKSKFKKNVQVYVTKTGGPSEADSLSQWKSGLASSNKTWSVIDREFKLIPIWKIILENHKEEFPDGEKLASFLAEIYELESGLTSEMMVVENPDNSLEKVDQFLQDVKTWNVNEATHKLKNLVDFKQTLNETMRSYNVWVTKCLSDKGLQEFLLSVVKKYKDSSAENKYSIKALLQELVDPHIYSVNHFPNSSIIMGWIYEKDELDQLSISDFGQLCDVLQKSLEDVQLATANLTSSTEHQHETKIKATKNISISLYSFLRKLRTMEQHDTELLIFCIANNFGYCVRNNHFQSLLGHSDIAFLIDQLKEEYEEYTNLKNQCVHRSQAFVIYTGLTTMSKSREISFEEKEERLNFMKQHLGSSLSSDVDAIIKECSEYLDFSKVEHDLKSFIDGIASKKVFKKDEITKELNELCQHKAPIKSNGEIDFNNLDQNVLPLFKKLDLEKYYPQKMKTDDFLKICRYSLVEREILEGKQLPLYFLQKLLMLDYCARNVHCKYKGDSTEAIPVTITKDDNGDKNEALLELILDDYNAETSIPPPNDQTIHPMDVQMAVFHCANDFMRQYIYNKLSFCQFALPLLVPNPSTNHVEFPLWSFQEVKKKWKVKRRDDAGKAEDKFIKETQTQFVSFIRFGQSESSKSQIMNCLMSKQRHNIFYHRHCQGATKESVLMNGIVEIAWYCPGGKEDDVFDDCIAFVNLHGDARDYDKQVKFLKQVSSVIVVFITESYLKDNNVKEMLQHLLETPLICLFPDKTHKKQIIRSNAKIGLKNRNEAELLTEIRTAIQSILSKSQVKHSLNSCADIARTCGFLIDEDREECKQGKLQAQTLLSLLQDKQVSAIKEEFLPLQGDLWHKWCVKDKDMTRLKGQSDLSIEQQRGSIEHQKQMIREEQVKKAFPLNQFMDSFLKILESDVQGSKMHFLQWFKMYLDDLSSQTLSDLYQEYHNMWSKVKEEKQQKKNTEIIEKMENELEKLSEQINISAFGLEHILRELGQIYEAIKTSMKKDERFFTLPKIAANLMVSGYPIELMDGDAAHVPLRWIGAVLDELIEILGDQRLYVLSVLGIQSTGKSTLLNAMFGLQFAVSAGRCTRGAFMQLIKIDEELRHEMNFDYVLVIDTEGLRALELSKKRTINHDNELATFVIGLGNLTLINIYGENPADIQDILQIAVQAFLRMKEVNLHPSCVFVHQNVGEITAIEKNMEGRRRLQGKLDEMTQCAAQQEQCDVTCFNDVIKFDVNTHIHYFAHLWEGDPPMAPPNPSYSQNVQTLKQVILDSGKLEKQKYILSFSQFKKRVEDLWNALLNENFVFSFKNSLEIAAYNKVEFKYSQWTWKLREFMLTLQTGISNKIHKDEIKSMDLMYLNQQFEQTYGSVLQDFEAFFDNEKDKELLVQWKVNTRTRINIVKDDLIEKILKKSKYLIRIKNNNVKMKTIQQKYEEEMLMKSSAMALSLKETNINDKKLDEIFNGMWNSLITVVTTDMPTPKPPQIDNDLEIVFLESFKGEANLHNIISESRKWENLIEEFSNYITSKPKYKYVPAALWHATFSDNTKRLIEGTTHVLRNRVNEYIDRKEQEKVDYQNDYFHEILNILQSEINTVLDCEYKFLREYTLYVSLFLCRRAVDRFDKMSDAFRKANDPVVYLTCKREEFWQSFRISCEGKNEIASLADFLCKKLRGSIQQAVLDKSAVQLSGELQGNDPALNGNRSKLDFCLLKSLAENENFSDYINYITDPKSSVSDFIKKRIGQYCDSKATITERVSINVDHFQNIIRKAIDKSTTMATDRHEDISSWLDTFCSELGGAMNLSKDDFKSVKHQGITDVGFLNEAMIKALNTVVEELKRDFSTSDLKELREKTHEILCDQLSGCWKLCPICRAVCTNTIPDHDGDHSVKFHRPRCVNGGKWYKTDQFAIEICSSLVASDILHVLSDDKKFPYKSYRNAGPPYNTWSITPDNSPLSYWKWVVCHFQSVLEKFYELRFADRGEIPQKWFSITKEQVILEIEKLM